MARKIMCICVIIHLVAQGVPVLRFLLVDVEQVLLNDSPAGGGLDALLGRIALSGGAAVHHHMSYQFVLKPI